MRIRIEQSLRSRVQELQLKIPEGHVQTGLLIGLSSVGASTVDVVDFLPTPADPDQLEPLAFKGVITDDRQDWIKDHVDSISRMLCGGMRVVGLALVGDSAAARMVESKSGAALRRILSSLSVASQRHTVSSAFTEPLVAGSCTVVSPEDKEPDNHVTCPTLLWLSGADALTVNPVRVTVLAGGISSTGAANNTKFKLAAQAATQCTPEYVDLAQSLRALRCKVRLHISIPLNKQSLGADAFDSKATTTASALLSSRAVVEAASAVQRAVCLIEGCRVLQSDTASLASFAPFTGGGSVAEDAEKKTADDSKGDTKGKQRKGGKGGGKGKGKPKRGKTGGGAAVASESVEEDDDAPLVQLRASRLPVKDARELDVELVLPCGGELRGSTAAYGSAVHLAALELDIDARAYVDSAMAAVDAIGALKQDVVRALVESVVSLEEDLLERGTDSLLMRTPTALGTGNARQLWRLGHRVFVPTLPLASAAGKRYGNVHFAAVQMCHETEQDTEARLATLLGLDLAKSVDRDANVAKANTVQQAQRVASKYQASIVQRQAVPVAAAAATTSTGPVEAKHDAPASISAPSTSKPASGGIDPAFVALAIAVLVGLLLAQQVMT